MMKNDYKTNSNTKDTVYIAFAAALIAICSWINVPLTVPVTLQTLAIFAIVGLFGLKRGTWAVIIYILLGAIGVPVFAGFKGGFGILIGNTGGYIIGFIFSALVIGLITKRFGRKVPILVIAFVLGIIVCYVFGTAWFMYVYTKNTGAIGIVTVLSLCVFPFIIPDAIKIFLAIIVVNRASKYINK